MSKTGLLVVQTLLPQVVWSQVMSHSILFMETASDVYSSTFLNILIWIIVIICPSYNNVQIFTNENLHKSCKQKLALSSKNVDCKIVDDENKYYIFETVTILLFNNETTMK